MLTFEPGETLAHRLDPRSKLAVQLGFAAAAFAHTTPRGLAVLSLLTAVVMVGSATSPIVAVRELRLVLVLLVAAPVIEGLRLGPPWFAVDAAIGPTLAGYRVLLVLFVSAAYVRTTPVRDSRAAIQRHVPGRAGQFLGVGVAAVFRFVPVLVADMLRTRDAMDARLGGTRPLHERLRIVATGGLSRAFNRADRYALALRARCFAWNPTLPALSYGWRDVPPFLLAAALAIWAIAPGPLSGWIAYALP